MFAAYRRFKKNTPLRKYATPRFVRMLKNAENAVLAAQRMATPVAHHSRHRAICHIGLQKTGSVWFREMFADPVLYRHSGLSFVDRAGKLEDFSAQKGIYAPIRLLTTEVEQEIAREGVATIAVLRDPVSLVLSWIKSTGGYHVSGAGDEGMAERRAALAERDDIGRVAYALEFFAKNRRFEQLERLLELEAKLSSMMTVRYEDCVFHPVPTFARIFDALDIAMPEDALTAFVARHSFEAYSGRRIDAAASEGTTSLSGGTHKEAAALDPAARAMIFDAVGGRLAAAYSADPGTA